MKDKKETITKKKKDYDLETAEVFDFTKSQSITDCTGVTPTPPLNDEEYESYLNVYDFGPDVVNNKKEKDVVK